MDGMIALDEALDRSIHQRFLPSLVSRGCARWPHAVAIHTRRARVDRWRRAPGCRRTSRGGALRSQAHGRRGPPGPLSRTMRDALQSAGDSLELAFRFMNSPAFDEYRELPFCGVGISLEEAFYRFCELESWAVRRSGNRSSSQPS